MTGDTEETGLAESDFPTDCQLERTEERTPLEQIIFVIFVVIVGQVLSPHHYEKCLIDRSLKVFFYWTVLRHTSFCLMIEWSVSHHNGSENLHRKQIYVSFCLFQFKAAIWVESLSVASSGAGPGNYYH